MAHQLWVVALSMAVATLPIPTNTGSPPTPAPAGTAHTRYCLRVDPPTGSRIETIQCRTRDEWAELDVNVDEEWAQNGVRVIA
jgi:hypothetical protein